MIMISSSPQAIKVVMHCPICKTDLSPLDFLSRTEHVDLCVENGPTIVEISETGEAVLKKNIPLNKQRKICPICDKTFQTIHTHYKKCALKHDILPDLMLDQWEQLNQQYKTSKKFPRDLLEGFIAQRIKEGRAGDQVEYAQSLLRMIADGQPEAAASVNGLPAVQPQHVDLTVNDSDTNQSAASTSGLGVQQQVATGEQPASTSSAPTVHQLLMQGAGTTTTTTSTRGRGKPRKTFRIEVEKEDVKRGNINLRRECELSVSKRRRFDRIQAEIDAQQTRSDGGESSSTQVEEVEEEDDGFTINWLDRLS